MGGGFGVPWAGSMCGQVTSKSTHVHRARKLLKAETHEEGQKYRQREF